MSIHLLAIHSLQIVHLMKQKNKLGCYRRKDCMEWFCKNIRDHTMKIINYEEKEMIPLTDKENRSYEMQKICYIYKKEFSTDNDKKSQIRDHCHYTGNDRGGANNICNLKYEILKEVIELFHIGSAYDYHFKINPPAKEFKGRLESFGENKEKYITF